MKKGSTLLLVVSIIIILAVFLGYAQYKELVNIYSTNAKALGMAHEAGALDENDHPVPSAAQYTTVINSALIGVIVSALVGIFGIALYRVPRLYMVNVALGGIFVGFHLYSLYLAKTILHLPFQATDLLLFLLPALYIWGAFNNKKIAYNLANAPAMPVQAPVPPANQTPYNPQG